MSIVALIVVGFALAMDAMSVALATSISMQKLARAQVARFSLSFGFFQAAMPVLGWWAGSGFREYIETWDHWIALTLLLAVGGKGIFDALRDDGSTAKTQADPTRGWSLLVLSVATSIDALAVGLSLAMIAQNIWTAAALIGLITATLTALAMWFGSRLSAGLGAQFARSSRIFGGLVLIAIGVKIVLQHTQLT